MGWFYIDATDLDVSALLKVTDGDQTTVSAHWGVGGAPLFTSDGGAYWHFSTSQEFRSLKKWVHMIVGSTAGTSFGMLTLRGVPEQVGTTWPTPLILSSTSTIMAPVDDPSFHVITN
jgi:hypothetical protein